MKLQHRITRLGARHLPPAVYPIYAVFGEDGKVERIRLSDASTRTGQDAIMTYRQLPRSIPLKAYVGGFDPDIMWQPLAVEVAHECPNHSTPEATQRGEPSISG